MAHYRAQIVWTGSPGSPLLTTLNSTSDFLGVPAFKAACLDLIGPLLEFVTVNLYGEFQDEVVVVDDATGQPVSAVSAGASGFAGQDASTPLPYQTQGLLRLATGVFVGGRRVSGRVFIPGATESVNSDGLPMPTYYGALTDAVQAVVVEHPGVLGVYSPKNATSYEVTGGSGWANWATLRSRRD